MKLGAEAKRLTLRPYQQELKSEIYKALRDYERVLAVLPTGGGKTVIFADIAADAKEKGSHVLILTHRREILRQILKALYNMGIFASSIHSGTKIEANELIQAGMIMTVGRRLEQIKAPNLIIVDEAHHAVAATWNKVLKHWPKAKIIGFTATPERLDGKGLRDRFDILVEGSSLMWLVEHEYLAMPKVYAAHVDEAFSHLHTQAGDYSKGEQASIFNDKPVIFGNIIKHYKQYLDGLPAIAYCSTIAHSKQTALEFEKAGYKASAIWGDMPDTKRDKLLQQLAIGEINVLASCEIISEGVDVPRVVGAILLRKTKSKALYMQQIGRTLRPDKRKRHAVVLDHVGNYLQHGHPLERQLWSLNGRPKVQEKANIKLCRFCRYAISPSEYKTLTHCPQCDQPLTWVRDGKAHGALQRLEGSLQEAIFVLPVSNDDKFEVAETLARAKRLRTPKARYRIIQEYINSLPAAKTSHRILQLIQKEMGYKAGWVYFQWKGINQA